VEQEWLPHVQVELTRAGVEAAKGRGNALFAQGDTKESVEWFSKAIWLVDSGQVAGVPAELRSILRSNRALALLELEQWEEAEADASAAVGLNAANTKARFRRATARVEMSRAEEALQDVEQVLSELTGEDDNRQQVLALRERILQQQGRPRGGGRAAPGGLNRCRSAPALPAASDTVARNLSDALANDEEPARAEPADLAARPQTRCVLLSANLTSSMNLQRIGQVRDILEAEGVPFEEVDGSDPANRELRTTLFGISGRGVEYPQIFLRSGAAFGFVAGHAEVHEANEISGLIKAQPQLAASINGARQPSLQELFRDCLPPPAAPPRVPRGGADAWPAAAAPPRHGGADGEAEEEEAAEDGGPADA